MSNNSIPLIAITILCLLTCAKKPVTTGAFTGNNLRVIDINVWSGLDYQGSLWMGEYESADIRIQRHNALLTQLKALQPDVLTIHEANKLPSYANDLARELNFDVYSHVGVGGVRAGPIGLPWNLREGDAILARKELNLKPLGREQLSGDYVGDFFTFHFDDATQILAGQVEVNGQKLVIVTTHWHSSPLKTESANKLVQQIQKTRGASDAEVKEALGAIDTGSDWRIKESQKTLTFMKGIAGDAPCILTGDFNSTADTAEMQMLTTGGMQDTFAQVGTGAGETWDPGKNVNQIKYYLAPVSPTFMQELEFKFDLIPKRIDFILLNAGRKDIVATTSKVVLNELTDGLHPSDHFGIMTDFKFK